MSKFISLMGQKFGRLTVVKDYMENKIHVCECRCACGNMVKVRYKNLITRHTRSCGCLLKDMNMMNFTQHSLSRTRFHRIWNDMKNRCLNPNSSSYEYYGGRGINVCNGWLVFHNFCRDMYESYVNHCNRYGEKDTSLDRINVDGDYCKDNCRWATLSEQNMNRRM